MGPKSTGAWSYQMRNSGHKVFAEAFLPMRGTLDNAWKDMKFGVEMAEEAGVSCPAFAMLRDRYNGRIGKPATERKTTSPCTAFSWMRKMTAQLLRNHVID